jgi:hypothetical protein
MALREFSTNTSKRKGLVCVTLCAMAWLAMAAEPPQASASKPASSKTAPSNQPSLSKLDWQSLNRNQQEALRPLAKQWPELSDTQKKKWIALSANYSKLFPADKERLRERMVQWAALTPRQRMQARLNFSATQRVQKEDKAERWEVYQSLTAEQKRALAASAPKPTLAPRLSPASPAR